jgi:hypothetical protein
MGDSMSTIINATTTNGVVIQPDNSGSLQLATNSGTTALTIDTSQNVGIGTSSFAFANKLIVKQSADNSAAGLGARIERNANDSSLFLGYRDNSDSWQVNASYGSTGAFKPITFHTSDTERMRIDSSGNVFIGDTAQPSGFTTVKFYVKQTGADWVGVFINSNSTAANCYGSQVKYTAASPNGTGNEFFAAVDSSATRMTLRSNGGIANYQGNNVNLSDAREKTNIELASSYLDKICAIPVKTFNYIDQNMEEDGGLTLGVIAQDVQAVAPELIMESNWASKDKPEKLRLSIYQTDLQYALMKCIQEQQTIINDLKARVEALEAKLG